MPVINGYTIIAWREAYGGYVILGVAPVQGDPMRLSYVVATISSPYDTSWYSGDYDFPSIEHAVNRYSTR